MKEGLGYVRASPAIRSVLGLLGLVNLMSMPTTILLPLVASDVLHGGADTLGFADLRVGRRGIGGEPVSGRPPQRVGAGTCSSPGPAGRSASG